MAVILAGKQTTPSSVNLGALLSSCKLFHLRDKMQILCLQGQAWVLWYIFHYFIYVLFFLAVKEMSCTKLLSSCLLFLPLNNFRTYWPIWKWVVEGIRDNCFSTCFMKISCWIDGRSKLLLREWQERAELRCLLWPVMPTCNCNICFLFLGSIVQKTLCRSSEQGDGKLSGQRAASKGNAKGMKLAINGITWFLYGAILLSMCWQQ